MPRLTDDEIKQIEERCNKATPGPWRRDSLERGSDIKFVISSTENIARNLIADCPWKPNTIFIANARQDIPRLLAEVKALRKVYDVVKDQKSDTDSCWKYRIKKAISEYESNDKTT